MAKLAVCVLLLASVLVAGSARVIPTEVVNLQDVRIGATLPYRPPPSAPPTTELKGNCPDLKKTPPRIVSVASPVSDF